MTSHRHRAPRRRIPVVSLLAILGATGCASLPVAAPGAVPLVAVATPFDGVPLRSLDTVATADSSDALDGRRDLAFLELRSDLAAELRRAGIEVVEVDTPALAEAAPTDAELAALGRESGADAIVLARFLAYGDIRRSWLWVLAGQGLLAGIGHGVAVAAATGDAGLGCWAGGAEFALETVTWVGGAVLGSRGLDPVLARIKLVRTSDGAVVADWTLESTRPWRRWFRKKGVPPRNERLRSVADRVFEKLASRVARRIGVPPPNR